MIKEKLWATYQFSINTKPATSTYRNVRVRFWTDWEWYWLWAYNSVSAQYSYFTKAFPCFFVFKEQSATTTTAKYFSAVYVNTTYSAMSASEAQTWTATTGRTMTAKVLADEIARRLWLYHDDTKQDVISDLDTIKAWAAKWATALQSFTETDPVYSQSPAATITTTDISNWNWKGSYSKPSGWIPKSDLASTVQTSLWKADTALQSFTETDPIYSNSPAAWIGTEDINAWNSKQDSIADLWNIRTQAWQWATAYSMLDWVETLLSNI